jgi:hypothetical protein
MDWRIVKHALEKRAALFEGLEDLVEEQPGLKPRIGVRVRRDDETTGWVFFDAGLEELEDGWMVLWGKMRESKGESLVYLDMDDVISIELELPGDGI